MELNPEVIDRLQGVFDEGWRRVRNGFVPEGVVEDEAPANIHPMDRAREEWIWTLWMNGREVLIITHDDLVESFSDMVNFGNAVKDSVCLLNPSERHEFLLVPNSLAEKCLALGAVA